MRRLVDDGAYPHEQGEWDSPTHQQLETMTIEAVVFVLLGTGSS